MLVDGRNAWKADPHRITITLYDEDVAPQCKIRDSASMSQSRSQSTKEPASPSSMSMHLESMSGPTNTSTTVGPKTSTTLSSTPQPVKMTQTEPNETHILIFAGRNSSGSQQDIIEFIPETKKFTILDIKTQYKVNSRNVGVWVRKVIVDGGYNTASFEVFDSMPLVKLMNPVIPIDRYEGCGGVANAKFYACFGLGDANVGKTCDVYDLNNNYAHTMLNMQIGFHYARMACVFTDEYVYTVGGYDTDHFNYFYRFNLDNGTVAILPNYPLTLQSPSAVLYQGNIVSCGGYPYTNECHLYNFTSAQWQSFANLNAAVYRHSCANWGPDKIVCMGGYPYSDKVELYENGVWTDYANMPYAMLGHKAVLVGG